MQETKREEILRTALNDQHILTCYAYSLLQDWGLAKDAYQEMLITASSKWESYKAGNLSAWLRVILKRKAFDMMKSRKKSISFADEELFSLVDKNINSLYEEKGHEYHERKRDAMKSCMKNLRQESLEILLAFYKDRVSCESLAQKLGKTVNSIWLTLSRSRKVLRKCALEKLANDELS